MEAAAQQKPRQNLYKRSAVAALKPAGKRAAYSLAGFAAKREKESAPQAKRVKGGATALVSFMTLSNSYTD